MPSSQSITALKSEVLPTGSPLLKLATVPVNGVFFPAPVSELPVADKFHRTSIGRVTVNVGILSMSLLLNRPDMTTLAMYVPPFAYVWLLKKCGSLLGGMQLHSEGSGSSGSRTVGTDVVPSPQLITALK